MFVVEGELAFNTQRAIGNAKLFQKELKTTGQFAERASRGGRDLESAFQGLGSQKTRAAIRSLQSSLSTAKDGTDVAIAGAKALQVAMVRSLGGTAVVAAAGVLADSIRDVATMIKTTAQESARATKNMGDIASSFQEGAARAASLTTAADNVLKTLDSISAGSFFTRFINDATGATKELKAQEETLRRISRSEFQMGAFVGRKTAERRVGMTPEQIAEDIRAEEEKRRLAEAEKMGGESAKQDVQATINAENLQRLRQKDEESQKKFNEDLASFNERISDLKQKSIEEENNLYIQGLPPQQRIAELKKEQEQVARQILSIEKTGIFGTEKARKKQLDSIVDLKQKDLDLSKNIAKAKKDALEEEKREKEEVAKRDEEERKRERNFERERKQMMDEARRNLAQIKKERMASVQSVALRSGGGILGASRAGMQAQSVAQRQRQREATTANFKLLEGGGSPGQNNRGLLQQVADQMNAEEKRMGGSRVFSKRDAMKRIAQQQAAMENPFLSEQLRAAGTGGSAEDLARFGVQQKQGRGSQDLINVLDRLVSAMESAPYVTSGSGR